MSRPGDEILIEWVQYGQALEVRVIDAFDGLEVSFAAPSSTTEVEIKRLAGAKLAYVRRKQLGSDSERTASSKKKKPPKRGPGGRGVIV